MVQPGLQTAPEWDKIDKLGSRLSLEVCNGVRWPGFDKNMFVCPHNFPIPVWRLFGDGWQQIKEEHDRFVNGHCNT